MGQPNRGIYKPRKVNPVRDRIMAALRKGDATVSQLVEATGYTRETLFNHVHDLTYRNEVHICALDSTHSGPPARTFRIGPRPLGFVPARTASPLRAKAQPVPTGVQPSPPCAPWSPPPQHPIIEALFKGYAP